MDAEWVRAIEKLKAGDVTPALLTALSTVFEEWARDPEKLTSLSVRDTISLVNAVLGAQKVQVQAEAKATGDAAFNERLRLVKKD